MPLQKGKRRRRPRSRGSGAPLRSGQLPSTAATPTQDRGSKPTRRRGWQLPLWGNVALGIFMLAAGAIFFLMHQKGVATQQRLVLLLAYLVVAGFYLGTAFRQWKRKRQT